MAIIFLSHSSRDKPLARRIEERLKSAGHEVWIDERGMLVGDSFVNKIQQGLEKADFVAVLLTSNSVSSRWVEMEWQGELVSDKRRVLPILAEDCKVPRLLKGFHYADIRKDFDTGMERLLEAIENPVSMPASDVQIEVSAASGPAARSNLNRPAALCSITFGVLFGILPLVALGIEHGERMWWFALTRPHFFYFNALVAPHVLYYLLGPASTFWSQLRSRAEQALIACVLLGFAAMACWYDYRVGIPGLFELQPVVQDAPHSELNRLSLWHYDRNAAALIGGAPDLQAAYKSKVLELSKLGYLSWVEVPYYASMFAQILLALSLTFLIVVTLFRMRWALRTPALLTHLAASSVLYMTWLPMHAAFIENKRIWYGDAGATQVIYYMAVVLVLLGTPMFLILRKRRSETTNTMIFVFVIQLIVGALSTIDYERFLPWLFSRSWQPEWYPMLYLFIVGPIALMKLLHTEPEK